MSAAGRGAVRAKAEAECRRKLDGRKKFALFLREFIGRTEHPSWENLRRAWNSNDRLLRRSVVRYLDSPTATFRMERRKLLLRAIRKAVL